MVKDVVTKFTKVDILVNNAGVHIRSNIDSLSDEIWNVQLGVNLTGMLFCSRAVVQEMVRRGEGGRIVNIGSFRSKAASAGEAAYCASKFGVLGLTQSLALELASHNILVNAVCPALTDTGVNVDMFEDDAKRQGISVEEVRTRMNERVARQIPLGRLGTTVDIANVVTFLVSEEASFITGQSINVNGGLFTAL